jgi:cell division protein FtsB
MSDTKWLTYAEIAEALGIGGDSARNLVRRKRWPRQPGNDGLTRVGVPVEHLEAAKDDAATNPPIDPPNDGGADGTSVIAVLTQHINRLETEIENLKQEREVERSELKAEIIGLKSERDAALARGADRDVIAMQLEALRTVLDAEKQRTEEWKAVADRFASQAETLAEAARARRGWWPWRRSA